MEAGAAPRVEAIVVNFNAGDALTRCIESLLAQNIDSVITVFDNASLDDSFASAKSRFSNTAGIHFHSNASNPGFATAVNLAVQCANSDSELLLLLNPDCEMKPGSLQGLVAAIDASPSAAIAAPRVVDDNGTVLRGTLREFPTPWNSLMSFSGLHRLSNKWPVFKGVDRSHQLPLNTIVADAVSGACMLIRRASFQQAGGMDVDYGLHCEDLDLMYRIHQQGETCLLVPNAVVFHDQGLSSRSRRSWVHYQKHRGMQRFYDKYQRGGDPLLVRFLTLVGIWARFALTLPMAWLRR